jgi:S-layer homology domain
MYYLGITAGTSATTFSPDNPVTRGQSAVFVSKATNQTLARSSRRAALGQWWTVQSTATLGSTPLPDFLGLSAADGEDIWVGQGNEVVRVRASDGRLLETWTNAYGAYGIQVAMGRIFITSLQSFLYAIDPSQPAGDVSIVADQMGAGSGPIAFDGSRLWTANVDSVSIVTPGPSTPWNVTTVSTGYTRPTGVVFDGNNVWVSDYGATSLFRVDSSGSILQTVATGGGPNLPAFDGSSIWVPNSSSNSVTVVRVSDGSVIATLTGNGLSSPSSAAFDGQRVLVTGTTLSLWKAADLTPIGFVPLDPGEGATGVCSDGINFWISRNPDHALLRF